MALASSGSSDDPQAFLILTPDPDVLLMICSVGGQPTGGISRPLTSVGTSIDGNQVVFILQIIGKLNLLLSTPLVGP